MGIITPIRVVIVNDVNTNNNAKQTEIIGNLVFVYLLAVPRTVRAVVALQVARQLKPPLCLLCLPPELYKPKNLDIFQQCKNQSQTIHRQTAARKSSSPNICHFNEQSEGGKF